MKKLPDFFLAGAVKSGTTTLYHYLDEHPAIYMSPIKEPHYFSAGDMDLSAFRPLVKKRVESFDLKKYLQSSMKQQVHRAYIQSWDDYVELFKNVKDETRTGEASTSYLWSPSAPLKIREKIPDARIIIILRNPVERAFAHYLMDLRIGLANDSFAKTLQADQEVADPSWGKNSMYVQTGMYAAQVKRYLDIFPASRILIILQDELKKDPAGTMKNIYSFLEVYESFRPDFSKTYNVSYLPVNRFTQMIVNNTFIRKHFIDSIHDDFKAPFKRFFFTSEQLPVMSPDEKSKLIHIFEKDVFSLGKLINKDLSHWLR